MTPEEALSKNVEKVLTIKDGDVLLLRGDVDPFEAAEDLSSALAGRSLDSCVLFYLPEGADLSVISDGEMEAHGWVRKPKDAA